jgi:glycine cleavage system regulatory protein
MELPRDRRTLASYAAWVDHFLDELGMEDLLVLGHSFGGGIATKLAHDHPHRVQYLVLLNSVGDPRSFPGSVTAGPADVRSRFAPMLDALRPSADGIVTTTEIQRTLMENLARNPLAVMQAAQLALTADLGPEMAVLAARSLPVLVLWSDHDGVIPMKAFDTFCSTFGTDGQVVPGGHSWLLADPDAFGEVLANVIQLQSAEHGARATTSSVSQLEALLGETSVPRKVATKLLSGLSPLWVLSEAPAVLAADLALCHPPLGPGEVRAVAREVPQLPNTFRLTVVAEDRPGLLADTTATLAREGVSVSSASAMTWPKQQLALHAVTVRSDRAFDEKRWGAIGSELREMAAGATSYPFVPRGAATVTRSGEGDGRSVVKLTATDRIGLLAAVCRWFADHGVSIEAADVETENGIAHDVFLVTGDVDVEALAQHLTAPRQAPRNACAVMLDSALRLLRMMTSPSSAYRSVSSR